MNDIQNMGELESLIDKKDNLFNVVTLVVGVDSVNAAADTWGRYICLSPNYKGFGVYIEYNNLILKDEEERKISLHEIKYICVLSSEHLVICSNAVDCSRTATNLKPIYFESIDSIKQRLNTVLDPDLKQIFNKAVILKKV